MTTLEELERAIKTACYPGGLMIFQCAADRIPFVDKAIREIMPLLKSKNIGVLLFDDDVSVVMVPEARRALAIPRSYG